MTKAHTTTDNSKMQRVNTKIRHQNFDNTTIKYSFPNSKQYKTRRNNRYNGRGLTSYNQPKHYTCTYLLDPLFVENVRRTECSHFENILTNASRERLPLRTPGSVPFFFGGGGACMCSDCCNQFPRLFTD